jgi:hypothetical protein
MQRAPLLLALAAAACGPKGGTATVANRGATGEAIAAPPAATLAEDVAELTRAANEVDDQSRWPQRVTFLGWTADHRVAYRVLACDPDALGGRGPYCDLRTCTADAVAEDDAETCENAAGFELYGKVDFEPSAATEAAEAQLAGLGPLAAGTPRALDAATLTITDLSLTVQLLDEPPRVLTAGEPAYELGVVSAPASYVGDSPDGRCRAVLGMGKFRSEYEGVKGDVPYPFAAVACK